VPDKFGDPPKGRLCPYLPSPLLHQRGRKESEWAGGQYNAGASQRWFGLVCRDALSRPDVWGGFNPQPCFEDRSLSIAPWYFTYPRRVVLVSSWSIREWSVGVALYICTSRQLSTSAPTAEAPPQEGDGPGRGWVAALSVLRDRLPYHRPRGCEDLGICGRTKPPSSFPGRWGSPDFLYNRLFSSI